MTWSILHVETHDAWICSCCHSATYWLNWSSSNLPQTCFATHSLSKSTSLFSFIFKAPPNGKGKGHILYYDALLVHTHRMLKTSYNFIHVSNWIDSWNFTGLPQICPTLVLLVTTPSLRVSTWLISPIFKAPPIGERKSALRDKR